MCALSTLKILQSLTESYTLNDNCCTLHTAQRLLCLELSNSILAGIIRRKVVTPLFMRRPIRGAFLFNRFDFNSISNILLADVLFPLPVISCLPLASLAKPQSLLCHKEQLSLLQLVAGSRFSFSISTKFAL